MLGSTGSVGSSTLEVIAASQGRFTPYLLAAHRSTKRLLEQAHACRPRYLVVVDPEAAAAIGADALPAGTRLAVGPEALNDLVQQPEVDRVVSAIVGAAGLSSCLAAAKAGGWREDNRPVQEPVEPGVCEGGFEKWRCANPGALAAPPWFPSPAGYEEEDACMSLVTCYRLPMSSC